MVIIELCIVLLIVLQLTPIGEPVRSHFGITGVVILVAVIGGLLFVLTELGINALVGEIFNPGNNVDSRRRMFKKIAPRTKAERKIDAMDDDTLQEWIDKNPRDALAVEALCERLKLRGDVEGYVREREYFLTLESKLSTEEKCSLYHELADLYLGRLDQPARAREALQAIAAAMPRSYQATLARQKLLEIEERDRHRLDDPDREKASM